MRYNAEQKEQTRQRILEAASKSFRRHGFEGAGVDGLAKAAGVTSGAFYTHFDSKATAFQQAIVAGLDEIRLALQQFQQQYGDNWLGEFTKFYLGEKRTCELGQSCSLQSLTPEVGRADEATREVFENELLKVAQTFANGLPLQGGRPDLTRSWQYLAMYIGGVTLARAVKNPDLAQQIADAVIQAVPQKV